MKDVYRKLMKQHGGSIPFRILGGVKQKQTIRRKPRKKRSRPKSRRNPKTKKRRQVLNVDKYSPGTIIRKQGELWKLTQSKEWLKV